MYSEDRADSIQENTTLPESICLYPGILSNVKWPFFARKPYCYSIQFNSISFIKKGTLQRTSKYSYSYYMIITDLLTCHQDLVRGGCYYHPLT